MQFSNEQPRVIGIGNRFRSDDAVGPAVVDTLRRELQCNADILELEGEGAALMDAWRDAKSVVIIDAVSSGGLPGTVYRINAHSQALPRQFFNYSTHAFSLAEAVELARTLSHLPGDFIIYGIEGATFEHGTTLSEPVRSAATEVAAEVLALIKKRNKSHA